MTEKWWPIETAPKHEWITVCKIDKNSMGYTTYPRTGAKQIGGWILDVYGKPFNATHWQPLPPPRGGVMTCWNKEELENMLEDVINVLELSEMVIDEHAALGTPPAELVRLVLGKKDRVIRNLRAGMVNAAAQAEAESLRLEVKELRECLAEILRWDGSGEVFDAFKVYDAREHARRLLESGAELEVVSVDC